VNEFTYTMQVGISSIGISSERSTGVNGTLDTHRSTRNETASGHSVGTVELLDDGRVRIKDEWEWESQTGSGESVLEEQVQNLS
jgi:hypothetical protein